ncbi:uncharacterized protein LOC125948892 [Anopheles darlingi]|uniref:uncharacterized protein LOC125948892 n=1 Tax=Anopheles darlingi TaxID=43151 RepID=UPI00210003AA|nr:uncharacterized protein LOC125948892 [Anopheles darlingi]
MAVYNHDELVAPDWLNQNFFLQVVRELDNDPSIELTSQCVLRPGTKMGDHYASVMYRTTVTYRSKKDQAEKSINLIMKTKPEAEGMKKELLEDDQLFKIEIRMYQKVLPEMARLLKSIGEEYKYPRYIYGALKPQTIFILEDISNQGWVMDELIQTYDDMKPIVKAIAMFHAASVIIESNDLKFAEEYNISLADVMLGFKALINKGFDDLMYLTEKYPEFAHFANPLENFKRNLPSILTPLYKPSASIQNVLIHGDFRIKNMLHQIDENGRHKDTILIDYQACNWTTPAIDLFNLLDIVADQTVKDNHRNELILLYHQQYTDLLKRMGFTGKIPTLLELQLELLRCEGFEMFNYLIFTTFRYIGPGPLDMDAMLRGEINNPALDDPEFRKLMHKELTRFLHHGVLNED